MQRGPLLGRLVVTVQVAFGNEKQSHAMIHTVITSSCAPCETTGSRPRAIEEYLPSNYTSTRPDKMDYLCPSPPPPDLGYSKATKLHSDLAWCCSFLLGRYSKPTPFTRIPTTRSGKWTLAGWLGSAPGISEALAQALLKSRPTGQSELEFVISIAQECANSQAGREKLVTMLRKGNALEGVAADMWYGVGQLATAKAAAVAENASVTGPNTPPPISPAKARANSGRSLTPKPPSPTSMLIDEHEKEVVAEAIQRAEEKCWPPAKERRTTSID